MRRALVAAIGMIAFIATVPSAAGQEARPVEKASEASKDTGGKNAAPGDGDPDIVRVGVAGLS